MNQLGVLVELFYSAALESQSLITRVAMVQQGDKSQGLPLKYHHPTLPPCWRSVFISFLVGSQMTEKNSINGGGKSLGKQLKKRVPSFSTPLYRFQKKARLDFKRARRIWKSENYGRLPLIKCVKIMRYPCGGSAS